GSMEIDFAGAYPTGATLTVVISARQGGSVIAVASDSITLSPTCTHAVFDFMSTGGSDMSGAVTDASGFFGDGGTNLGVGSACVSNLQCSSGFCTDNVCCDHACAGQCEACNSAGACVTVQGTPRGSRTPCNGSGQCGGTCDGTTASTCTYPTGMCMQSCT